MKTVSLGRFRRGSVVKESDWHPWGHGFYPWPCWVGWGSGVAKGCGVGRRLSLDPALLWLLHGPVAVALVCPWPGSLHVPPSAALESTHTHTHTHTPDISGSLKQKSYRNMTFSINFLKGAIKTLNKLL